MAVVGFAGGSSHGLPFNHLYLSVNETVRDSATVTTQWGTPLPDKIDVWSLDAPIARITSASNQSATITGLTPGCAFEHVTVDDTVSVERSLIVGPRPVDLAVSAFNPDAVFTMSATGCGSEPIQNPFPNEWRPASKLRWSPDGTRFAGGGSGHVRISNWDGTGVVELPTYGNTVGNLAWSPDGLQIAYGAFWNAYAEIHVINTDGTGDHVLVASGLQSMSADAPEWSPDGSRIVFHRGPRTGDHFQTTTRAMRAIYSIRPDGTDERVLVAGDPAHGPGYPAYSPDGSRILYLDSTSTGLQLVLMNPDGSSQGVIYSTPYPPDAYHLYDRPDLFHWSPNGQKIQLANTVMNADGTGALTLLEGRFDPWSFSWSSDSRQLAFIRDYGLLRVNADGTGLKPRSPYMGFQGAAYVAWRPTSPAVP